MNTLFYGMVAKLQFASVRFPQTLILSHPYIRVSIKIYLLNNYPAYSCLLVGFPIRTRRPENPKYMMALLSNSMSHVGLYQSAEKALEILEYFNQCLVVLTI